MALFETLGAAIGSILVTAASCAVAIVKLFKGKKSVNADYARERATNLINAEIERLVRELEENLATTDSVYKTTAAGSAGSLKFEFVLTRLHQFCIDNGFTWDEEAMKEAITNKVAFTKTVNSK